VPLEKSFTRRPNDDNGPLDDPYNDENSDIDLSNVPKNLRPRFRNFFNIRNASWLALYKATNHAIELKPSTEPPYIRMYNMSPAKLKALDDYINKALTKG